MPKPTAQNLAACAAGIFLCYLYYGIMQEKIIKTVYVYEDKEEKFHYTLVLALVQCSINALFSRLAMFLFNKGDDTTKKSYYAMSAFTLLGAMLASHQALQHIPYPTQVLGKSIKPIPVMVMGVLVAGKRYHFKKCMCVTLIVLGVAIFMYKEKSMPSMLGESDTVGRGELLLMLSLTMDGLAGAVQDKMKSKYNPEALTMMYFINMFQVLYLTIGVHITGEIFVFLKFIGRHPYVSYQLIYLSLASAVGQMFISVTITTFGSLTCSIVTTTRKFFTILGSVVIMRNPMSPRQMVGTSLVFVGLMMDVFLKARPKN